MVPLLLISPKCQTKPYESVTKLIRKSLWSTSLLTLSIRVGKMIRGSGPSPPSKWKTYTSTRALSPSPRTQRMRSRALRIRPRASNSWRSRKNRMRVVTRALTQPTRSKRPKWAVDKCWLIWTMRRKRTSWAWLRPKIVKKALWFS